MNRRLFATTSSSIGSVMKRRRALFNVPGSDARKLAKVPQLPADCIVLDLEDGVPINKKQEARDRVVQQLSASHRVFPKNSERAVRINSIGSGLEQADLECVLKCRNLDTLVIPKVETAKHLQFVDELIDQFAGSNKSTIKLIACIESAQSLLNLADICANGSARLEALVFASEDYCADTGVQRTRDLASLAYARSCVVNYAVAHHLQAIDIVCVDFKDEQQLQFECLNGKQFGFTGKQAIHPSQIETIQQVFVPSPEEVDKAQRIVSGYNDAVNQRGLGAFEIDGKMIDAPVLKAALRTLSAAGINQ